MCFIKYMMSENFLENTENKELKLKENLHYPNKILTSYENLLNSLL